MLLSKAAHFLRGPEARPDTKAGWLMKPIFDCPVCMSSVWGAIGFFYMQHEFATYMPPDRVFLFMICLCGLNTIITKLVSKERVILEE